MPLHPNENVKDRNNKKADNTEHCCSAGAPELSCSAGRHTEQYSCADSWARLNPPRAPHHVNPQSDSALFIQEKWKPVFTQKPIHKCSQQLYSKSTKAGNNPKAFQQ